MRIVIDIPKEVFEEIQVKFLNTKVNKISVTDRAIYNGTTLPEGHGRLIDADRFLKKVEKDREHEIYMHSWTADMVLKRLDSWYAPTIIEAGKAESEGTECEKNT